MKLARKLTLALVVGVLVIMAGYAWLQIRREVVIFDTELWKNEKFGHGAAAALAEIWAAEGEAKARQILETIDRYGPGVIRLRWLWLDELRAEPPPGLSADDLEQLAGRNAVALRETAGGEWVRHIYVPMSIPTARPAVIEVTESLQAERRYINMNHLQIALATALIAAMCALTAMGLGYWFVGRPMALLRDKARAVGAGNFGARLALRQHDELGEFAEELNAMSDRLAEAQARLGAETEARIATLEQLRHTDRLTTIGRLAAGIAHELGTPLNVIAGRAGRIAAAEGGRGQSADYARIIQEQATRMTAVIRQLLDFSRRQGPKPGLCNLRTLASRTIDLLAPLAEKQGVIIELKSPEGLLPVRVDPSQIQQAFANVVMNGIQAMPGGGRLLVSIEPAEAHRPSDASGRTGQYLRVTVEDQGRGIGAEALPHIFEPFFTTKDVGEGTGLGLSVAHGIVTDHGGWIDVESEPGRGTRVAIFLASAEPGTAEVAS